MGFSQTRAFLYSEGSLTDLGSFGGTRTSASGINDRGQIVGSSDITDEVSFGDADTHAFLYSGGTMIDLGTLGGTSSGASDINDLGQIVGGSQIAGDAAFHAFLYHDGRMMDLGTLGGTNSGASDINELGQIVGSSQIAGNAAHHAFLYSDGTMTNLNSLIDPLSGWTISNAAAINDSGQIAANSCSISDGRNLCRALLLSPVPEPEIYLMMLVGIGLLGMKLRRRNSVQS